MKYSSLQQQRRKGIRWISVSLLISTLVAYPAINAVACQQGGNDCGNGRDPCVMIKNNSTSGHLKLINESKNNSQLLKVKHGDKNSTCVPVGNTVKLTSSNNSGSDKWTVNADKCKACADDVNDMVCSSC